jgi:uncharacterized repeat protein (TIGR02543 family)|nr:MAG TPA_asm: hypothetical protein [Caudoviricetes sp.]
MATLILRPIGDLSLQHSCSAGSNGYALINEETLDNDGTYIYQTISSTSTTSATSSFKLNGFGTNVVVQSAKILFHYCNTSPNSESAKYTCALKQNNTTLAEDTYQRGGVTTGIYDELTFNCNELANVATPVDKLTLEITTSSSKKQSKNDDFQIRVSQVYLQITYTELSNTYNCAAVAKDNITAATVSNAQPTKGDSVVFTATYENYCPFLGWYGDEACTNLVSTDNPLTITPTEDLTLYAKAGENIGRTITLTMPNTLSFFIGKGVYLGGFKQDLLTNADYANLKKGNFSAISSEKVWEQNSATGATNKEHKTTVFVPKGCLLAMYGDPSTSSDNNSELYIYETSGTPLSYIPYYQIECDSNHDYIVGTEYRCECTASAGDGITLATVDYPELIQGGYATFTAQVAEGYQWDGWYSNSSYTTLASKDQTYRVQAPYKTSNLSKVTSIVLYAKATPTDQNYNLYLKQNGQWVSAGVRQLYVKENGKWVFKVSAEGVFDTNKNYVKGEV